MLSSPALSPARLGELHALLYSSLLCQGASRAGAKELAASTLGAHRAATRSFRTLDDLHRRLYLALPLAPAHTLPLLVCATALRHIRQPTYPSDVSAALAASGVPERAAVRTSALACVPLTQHTSPLAALVRDADLLYLASTPEYYDEALHALRAESNLEPSTFAATRARLITTLLSHPRIYSTPALRSLETRAKDNLTRELASLSAPRALTSA